jgi:hypothetical protein
MYGSASFSTLTVSNYISALSKWESIKPIRGRQDQNTRPLYRRGDDSKTIRQLNNGSIAFRLHSTDVVTFNKDGTVDLSPYASVTTCSFVRAVFGYHNHITAYWSDRAHGLPDNVTMVEGRYYNTPSFATLSKDDTAHKWVLLAGNEPFEITRLDKTLTKEALNDTGYNQFKLWLATQIRLGLDPRKGDSWRSGAYEWSERDVSSYLTNGPNYWGEMVRRMSKRCEVSRELEVLRRAVYKYAGAVTVTEVPYFEDYSDMSNAFASTRKYA